VLHGPLGPCECLDTLVSKGTPLLGRQSDGYPCARM
jgi:hypothetical protein